ncbi:MAG: hypothetical protein VXW34_05195 [Actinomycetota bacterium]|nr:hypothetical protein [Actinomycetota bacterium]
MGSRSGVSFVCVAMLVAAGCASGTDSTQLVDSSELSSASNSASTSLETDAEPTPSTTPEATSTVIEPTKEATPEIYDWSASLVGGGSIDLAGYANTAVVLWFWSPY